MLQLQTVMNCTFCIMYYTTLIHDCIKSRECIPMYLSITNVLSGITAIIKKKILVGARFFKHVQTGPGAHQASCTMGTRFFPGVKAAGAWC
jgi:hypothetical protein